MTTAPDQLTAAPERVRPGRLAPGSGRLAPVLVAARLTDLRGPEAGPVKLPLRLFWSGPSATFDLGDPGTRQWVYETVLTQARRPGDLTSLLHGPTLVASWPALFLPPGLRQAWEERHPVLRAATARAAAAA